jgi:hypothetical protein
MKTKTFLFLCLLLGMATTRLFSQNKTEQVMIKDAEYHTYVFCDGVLVDFLQGTARLHMVSHLLDGNWQWEIDQYKGEAISVGIDDGNGNLIGGTGEVFRVSEIDFIIRPTHSFPYLIWHETLIGNQGHVYAGFVYYDWSTSPAKLYPGKTECN